MTTIDCPECGWSAVLIYGVDPVHTTRRYPCFYCTKCHIVWYDRDVEFRPVPEGYRW